MCLILTVISSLIKLMNLNIEAPCPSVVEKLKIEWPQIMYVYMTMYTVSINSELYGQWRILRLKTE
jgi:hypothetical protein